MPLVSLSECGSVLTISADMDGVDKAGRGDSEMMKVPDTDKQLTISSREMSVILDIQFKLV